MDSSIMSEARIVFPGQNQNMILHDILSDCSPAPGMPFIHMIGTIELFGSIQLLIFISWRIHLPVDGYSFRTAAEASWSRTEFTAASQLMTSRRRFFCAFSSIMVNWLRTCARSVRASSNCIILACLSIRAWWVPCQPHSQSCSRQRQSYCSTACGGWVGNGSRCSETREVSWKKCSSPFLNSVVRI